MNAPCPKFITSIRPKISVSPDAIMKIIMPIASPATVSVSQVDVGGIRKRERPQAAAAGATGDSRSGTFGSAAPTGGAVALIGAYPGDSPSSRVLQCFIGGKVAHRAVVDHASVVHHATVSPSSCANRKFWSTNRIVALGASPPAGTRSTPIIAGARPLVGSSISSRRRGSTKARERRASVSARRRAFPRAESELLERRKELEIQSSALRPARPRAPRAAGFRAP